MELRQQFTEPLSDLYMTSEKPMPGREGGAFPELPRQNPGERVRFGVFELASFREHKHLTKGFAGCSDFWSVVHVAAGI